MIFTITSLIGISMFAQISGARDRRVNLALETVIKLDEPTLRADVNFIDKMQSFLSRIQGAIREPDDVYRRRNQQDAEEKHLVEYLKNAIAVILTYDDEDLKSLAKILNEEIRKYHYKGCKFHELASNKIFKKIMRQTLDELDKAPASVVRFHLNNALNGLKNDREIDRKLMDFMNSLYNRDAKNKVKNVVNNFKFYKIRARAADDRNDTLQKVVKKAVKDLVFDHYSSLNDNARRTLRIHINAYLDDLFKPNGANIGRQQGKRLNAHLIGSDEIRKLFKEPKDMVTVTMEEKDILRGGNKNRVTKGLMENVQIVHETTNESEKDDSESDTDTSADSLNDETVTEAVTKKVTKKKIKKHKKAKTTKKSAKRQRMRTNKAKRFKTQKNTDAVWTIWEEIQTVEPKPFKTMERARPRERVIYEEQNAIFNIGTWQNGLRKPSSEDDVNLRADDLQINIHNADIVKTVGKSTQESEDEGMTLEFDKKTKPSGDGKKSLRKNIRDRKETEKKLRAGEDNDGASSDPNNNSSEESNEKEYNKDKPKDKQPLNDEVSQEYSPEIDSSEKVTAALIGERKESDTRKLMTQRDKSSSNEEKPTATTMQKNLMKLSTTSLSEEDDENNDTNKDLTEANPAPAKETENSENPEVLHRRDNDRDNFGIRDSTSDDKAHLEEVRTNETPKQDDNEIEKNPKNKDANPGNLKDDNQILNTVTNVNSAELSTTEKPESNNEATAADAASVTTENNIDNTKDHGDDDTKVNDEKATEPKAAENGNLTKHLAKENATIGLQENAQISENSILNDMLKELDAAGEKSENKEHEKPFEDNQVI